MKRNSHETFSQVICSAVLSCFFFTQFRFATCIEKLLVLIGLISAAIGGMCVPMIIILYGRMADIFIQYEIHRYNRSQETVGQAIVGQRWIRPESYTREMLTKKTHDFAIFTAILGTAQFVFGATFVSILNLTSQKQVLRLRFAYFKALLHHEVGWYDLQTPHELSLNSITYINQLHEGLGEKLGIMTHTVVSTVTCLAIALSNGWLLAVVLLSVAPILCIVSTLAIKISRMLKSQEARAYAPAEALAEDALINIRSVAVYQGEKAESAAYLDNLEPSVMASVRAGSFIGFTEGLMWVIMYCSYALAFYFGLSLTLDKNYPDYTPPVLIVIFFNVQIGLVNFLQIPVYMRIMLKAKRAAEEVFAVIDRVRTIDSEVSTGVRMSDIKGHINFYNVHFCYPSNPSLKVLQGVTFNVEAGDTVVFVGFSGVGKTTCMRLIDRLYDVQMGNISIDNVNIRKISLPFLRSVIGYVQQSSVIFGATITDVIRCGMSHVSMDGIIEVAKIVDAHDTIIRLNKGYQSLLLMAGLADEMKQRLAIARVLLRKPKILILDNACSCMSPESELKLVEALKKLKITIVIVTSRMSVMEIADRLLMLGRGVIIEEGHLTKLMANKSEFYDAVTRDLAMGGQNPGRVGDINAFEALPSQRFGRAMNERRPRYLNQVEDEYERQDIVHVSRFPTFLNIAAVDKPLMDGVDHHEMRKFSWTKILKLNVKEWPFLLIACVAATITGFSLPAYAVLFGECLGAIAVRPERDLELRIHFFTQMFLVAGFLSGVALLVQGYMLAIAGSKLTRRLRRKAFDAMLRQDMAWFDLKANELDNLLKLLRVDAVQARAASGPRLTALTRAACVLAVCTGLSLYYNWKLGLAITCFVPFMLTALLCHSRMVVAHTFRESSELQKSKDIADEAIENIKIVAALGLESCILQQYYDELKRSHNKLMRSLKSRGIVYGLAMCTPSYAYAACILYGASLIDSSELPFESVFKVAEALVLGTIMVAQLVAFAPNIVKAQMSAAKLLLLVKRTPAIYSPTVVVQKKWKTSGNIKFRAVTFRHPTRVGLSSLTNFNLQTKEGQTVALVGPQGCGKTVPTQLLLRFYNTTSGTVLLDDRDIAGINLRTLRNQIGLADGDPIFFNRSVADNIAYGDHSRQVHMDDIMAAAKEADIHNYIATLPEGYNTLVDQATLKMTYGQKVRLSLARALLRDPSILLIENLQAAEDEDAEMLVESAIERACMGRTCILVSRHIKSAIRKADVICVMHNDKIVEEGTHHGLIDARGLYYRLYCYQELLTRRTESELLRSTILNE